MINNKSEYMMIGNKRVTTRTEEIDIFELEYYPENPRINFILSKYGSGLDQNVIEQNLWSLDKTKKLAEEIRINGGLLEEVIVLNDQVVEGNTRLCCYRHLYKSVPEEQKDKWKSIRAKKILGDIDVKDLFLLLGKLHIQGKTEWDPYEKASYINKMIDENGISIDDVSKIVGMTASNIKTHIEAYELMRHNYLPKLSELNDKETEIKKFSIFLEYYKSPDLQKIKNESPDILSDDKFIGWVLEGRIASAAYDVRKDLADILKCKPARKVFLNNTPEDAVDAAREIVALDRPETADSFFNKLDQMTKFLEKAKVLEIKAKVTENPRMKSLIQNFHSEVEKFCRVVINAEMNEKKSLIIPINKKNRRRFN